MTLPLPEAITAARDAAAHRADHQYLHKRFNAVVDVRDYGAVGGDTDNQATAITNAYNATPTGGVLFFPPGFTFRITSAITIAKQITIIGYGSTLHQVTSGAKGLNITASGVEIWGLTLQGRHTPGAVTYTNGEAAIALAGTVGSPLAGSTIVDCKVYGWGKEGVTAVFVNDIRYEGNYVHDCGYVGIAVHSTQRGTISRNHVYDIGPGTSGNAYGIAVTRVGPTDLATDPRSSDILVANNIVKNIPVWEGLDTHGGQRITFLGNLVINCYSGIALTTTPLASGNIACVDCSVIGNTVISTRTDGTADPGIANIGGSSEPAYGGVITGNTVIGHGTQSNSAMGGILVYITRGMVISNNYTRECSPAGISCYHSNQGITVIGNVSEDSWSSSVGEANGIKFSSNPSSGIVSGNIVTRGSKSATFVNTGGTNGVYVSGSNDINVAGVNRLFT